MTIEKQQSTECVEPVAYIRKDQLQKAAQSPMLCEVTPEPRQDRIGIYTSPPNVPPARASKSRSDVKPWAGLTDEERNAIGRHHAYVDNIIRATEAKLKEKNDF